MIIKTYKKFITPKIAQCLIVNEITDQMSSFNDGDFYEIKNHEICGHLIKDEKYKNDFCKTDMVNDNIKFINADFWNNFKNAFFTIKLDKTEYKGFFKACKREKIHCKKFLKNFNKLEYNLTFSCFYNKHRELFLYDVSYTDLEVPLLHRAKS